MRRPLTFCFSSSIRRSAVAAASAAVALAACAGLPEPSQITAEPGEVVIRRDAYGAPHIFAQSDYGLFYGYGYALAEDRLFQLEMLKRSSQGRVAEALGAAYADFDEGQRRLYWPSDIRAQIDAAPQNMRDAFQGMADGLNAHIARVEADPDALTPRQFLDFDFKPTSWSEYDVVMLFVGTMLLRYGGFNTELENLAFLNDLVAQHGEEVGRRIFDDVLLRGAADAPTTIPVGADRGAHRRRRSVATAPARPAPHSAPQPVRLAAVPAAGSAFSNAFVLGGARLKEGEALLVNGPQFGWYAPGYTYTVGFHAPGWNAVGNAPVGYPLPMFGYNEAITWGTTWGAGDNVDLFEERLNPDGSDSYFHKGAYKPLDVREETIGVRGAPDRDATFYRSVHGPIIRMDRGEGRAYAKQRGWAGRELETLAGWMEATKARSHKEWRKAVSKSALNVNWYFAGANGDIGYMFAGAYPKRHPEHDHRLPVSGEGAMDWRGVHPPSWNPQALNPPEGYFANWNNRPAADFPNPDMWWYSWSRADRVETLQKAIEAAGPLSADDAWALMMDASFVDPNTRYFLPPLLEALASEGEASAASEQARAALTGWDGSFADLDEERRYAAPAVAIFQTWLGQLLEDTLGDDLPGAVGGAIAATTGYGTPDAPTPAGLNISVGLKVLFEAIEGRTAYDYFNGAAPADAMRDAFAKSVQELTARFGSDVANWRLPAPPIGFKTSNFLGVPQATAADKPAAMREMNRGTENNMTLFLAGEARGWEVTPPGQSGFVAPDGTRAAHFDDQMVLFESLSRRRLYLKEDDVLADMTAETVLTPPRR